MQDVLLIIITAQKLRFPVTSVMLLSQVTLSNGGITKVAERISQEH